MGKQLKEAYGNVFAEMAKLSKAAAKIDETQVYEEANLETRKYMKKILDDNFLPESGPACCCRPGRPTRPCSRSGR